MVASSPFRRLPSNHHGLGHLLNPTDPDSEDRDWMRQVWAGIVQQALGRHVEWSGWLDHPATVVGRHRMRTHRLRSDTTVSREHARLRPPMMPHPRAVMIRFALPRCTLRQGGSHTSEHMQVELSGLHLVVSAAEAWPRSFP